MKKFIISLLAMLPMLAHADEAVIDGINYNIVTKAQAAEVIANSPGYSGDIVIPSSVEYEGVTYNVTKIKEKAFYQCKNLTSVSIPESVTSIGKQAFLQCI